MSLKFSIIIESNSQKTSFSNCTPRWPSWGQYSMKGRLLLLRARPPDWPVGKCNTSVPPNFDRCAWTKCSSLKSRVGLARNNCQFGRSIRCICGLGDPTDRFCQTNRLISLSLSPSLTVFTRSIKPTLPPSRWWLYENQVNFRQVQDFQPEFRKGTCSGLSSFQNPPINQYLIDPIIDQALNVFL